MSDRVRLRIRFAKVGKIRWTSHRDVARMWERAFRRVELPLAYSEGFSPRPKVSFGLALPTGHESVAEFLDVELRGLAGVDLDRLADRLSAALPVGVDATAVSVLEPGTPSLQEDVTSCSWRWTAAPADGEEPVGEAEMRARVAGVMAAPTLEVTRSRKGTQVTEDVRPGILALEVVGDSLDGVVLEAELAAAPRAVRPAEVLSALGPGLEERHVRRTSQWIQRHGAPQEPLLAARDDATEAPHAMERAS
ncbi:MAG: TIGR03936 family radical SAM-associated protein [Actinomycetota bacterium]|nr:TIGR03936 family radical SAM-associated protein [Actinomycetota bacterium]